jgi:segregation and condensation protein B
VSNTGSEVDAEESAQMADADNSGESVADRAPESDPAATDSAEQRDEPTGDAVEAADPAETPEAVEQAGDSDVADEPDEPAPDQPASTEAEAADFGQADPPVEREEPATAASAKGRPDLDDPDTLRAVVESILFVSDSPVTVTALATGLQRPIPDIQAALAALSRVLDERGSGVELREVGDGVRLYTRPALAGWIEAFLMDGQRVRLTQAALETLAVIAYRQPVTRARISAIRGVNVDGVVRTLISRGLITEVGADPDTGGGMYRTTELFLEKMGLRSVEELPSLAPLLPELSGLESDELSG